ncbi:hypothetical protein BZL41_18180 [Pseudomonas sp. PIC25]|uniref:type II toxin-antitoxin system RelE/ParE family toxin n=1 Tax=Pseudomonas sp. PIC25 TaxID=1958773 RepID=UPI000BAB4536|nr:type II toxin-antitoxin system RelE/ParE family toxin [Pseudomonas sp. PIC25]PAU58266.1 hypothetical protein BZL41_18180 [Pseudomonas sp. PIC25]
MSARIPVHLTANFERNLQDIERFLTDADAAYAFDQLLDDLLGTVLPNLERFPNMGRSFMARRIGSVEVSQAIEGLRSKLGDGELREYLLPDYLLLYAHLGEVVYLLSIRHHRQLSFDFAQLWNTGHH